MQKIGTDVYVLDTHGHSAILSNTRLILFDTGIEEDATILLAEIQNAGYKPTDIQNIILTHRHMDHIAGLKKIKTLVDAKVACHELDADVIGAIDDRLADNQIYEGFLVIHTPGHTEGNIALLDQEADLLIAGDSFRNDPDGLNHMPDNYNNDPVQHRQSIKKLANFNFSIAIVGHGDPVEGDASNLLKSLIDKNGW